jgi:hypothetical protein
MNCHDYYFHHVVGTGSRSAYFRQIEEDAEKHAATILELKDAIGSFQSKDMGEVARFLEHVERQLVCLTDETQASSCSSHRRARSPEAS